VEDRETGLPLPGAHVFVTERSLGTVTSRTGTFAFPTMPEGPQRVRVSFLGYATLDTLLNARPEPHRLTIAPSLVSTAGVIIEAPEIRPGDQAPLPGMLAPPLALLERLPASLGGQDLLEALSWSPGVRRAGEVTGGLLIRGAGPDQNLYLLDGAPVYHPWHAFSLISTFQTETFRSARLYRGSYPAEFGGRLSAVLDADLADGSGTEPEVSAALNTHSARFIIEAPLSRRASFMLAGRRSYVDRLIGRQHPVSDAAGRVDTLRTGYYFYDWVGKVVFRPDDRSRLSIMSYRGRDELDLRLPFDLSLDLSSWLRPTDLLFEVGQFWRNSVVSTRYERLLSARWYLVATAHHSRYQAAEEAFLRPSLSSSVRSDYQVDIRDTGVRLDLDYFHSATNRMRLGVQAVGRDFESDIDALIDYNPNLSERLREASNSRAVELSAYLQSTWLVSRSLEVRSGLRASAFGSDRIARIEPRFSVQWTGHPRLLLIRASYNRTHQYLHRIRDRHSFLYDLVSSRWIPSSRSVAPARGTEAAFDVESRPGDWSLRTSAYWRSQAHVLLPRDAFQAKSELAGPGIDIGTLLGQYEAGDARAVGVEGSAAFQAGGVLATLAASVERSETRGPSDPAGYILARYDVPVSLRSYLERRTATWSYGIGAIVRSGYPITVPVAAYQASGPLDDEPTTYLYRPATHNGRLPLYWRLDANVGRRFDFLDLSWHAQLQVYNVLNHRNIIGRFFEPEGAGVRVVQRRGLPILPLFELRVDL
ncbi:MAG: TonB-dependent receptor, partial [Rhodothermales bacterium]|nr:TonB-dependent receptor [Rhodothermales bacterium]